MKICAYSISKNEAQNVPQWLKNTKEADYRVVVDTGSTDNTVELLKAAGVNVIEQQFEPFRFDSPRNLALSNIPTDTDWCISPDFDEWYSPGWRDMLIKTAEENPDCNTITYDIKLIKSSDDRKVGSVEDGLELGNKIHKKNFTWVKPIHEYLECLSEEKRAHADDLFLFHRQNPKNRDDFYYQVAKNNLEETDDWTMWFVIKGSIEKGLDDDILKYGHLYLGITESYTNFRAMTMAAISKVLANRANPAAVIWAIRAIGEDSNSAQIMQNLVNVSLRFNNLPLAAYAASNIDETIFRRLIANISSRLIIKK